MTVRPILFSAPMVRALMAGTKTQTRRVVKPQFDPEAEVEQASVTSPDGFQIGGDSGLWFDTVIGPQDAVKCPYGVPGDQLYVRETFSGLHDYDEDKMPPSGWFPTDPIWYWADGNPGDGDWTKPKPGIHQPRWASRLTLTINDVRCERLQEISEADARAEGASFHDGRGIGPTGWRHDLKDVQIGRAHV